MVETFPTQATYDMQLIRAEQPRTVGELPVQLHTHEHSHECGPSCSCSQPEALAEANDLINSILGEAISNDRSPDIAVVVQTESKHGRFTLDRDAASATVTELMAPRSETHVCKGANCSCSSLEAQAEANALIDEILGSYQNPNSAADVAAQNDAHPKSTDTILTKPKQSALLEAEDALTIGDSAAGHAQKLHTVMQQVAFEARMKADSQFLTDKNAAYLKQQQETLLRDVQQQTEIMKTVKESAHPSPIKTEGSETIDNSVPSEHTQVAAMLFEQARDNGNRAAVIDQMYVQRSKDAFGQHLRLALDDSDAITAVERPTNTVAQIDAGAEDSRFAAGVSVEVSPESMLLIGAVYAQSRQPIVEGARNMPTFVSIDKDSTEDTRTVQLDTPFGATEDRPQEIYLESEIMSDGMGSFELPEDLVSNASTDSIEEDGNLTLVDEVLTQLQELDAVAERVVLSSTESNDDVLYEDDIDRVPDELIPVAGRVIPIRNDHARDSSNGLPHVDNHEEQEIPHDESHAMIPKNYTVVPVRTNEGDKGVLATVNAVFNELGLDEQQVENMHGAHIDPSVIGQIKDALHDMKMTESHAFTIATKLHALDESTRIKALEAILQRFRVESIRAKDLKMAHYTVTTPLWTVESLLKQLANFVLARVQLAA